MFHQHLLGGVISLSQLLESISCCLVLAFLLFVLYVCALSLNRSDVVSWSGFRSYVTCMVQVSGPVSAIS